MYMYDFVFYLASPHIPYPVKCVTPRVFLTTYCVVSHQTLYHNTALYRISPYPIQPVILYEITLPTIISPILSLSQLLLCLDRRLMLLQNKRCRVNWVKDREDYLSLCCCQALSLTCSVRVAIWQLYSAASLSSENEKKKKKRQEKGRWEEH